MAITFTASKAVHLVCDACKRGRRVGRGLVGDPYRFVDPPESLHRTTLDGETVWVCDRCLREIAGKEKDE